MTFEKLLTAWSKAVLSVLVALSLLTLTAIIITAYVAMWVSLHWGFSLTITGLIGLTTIGVFSGFDATGRKS